MTVVAVLADWSGTEPDQTRVGPRERRAALAYPPWRRREWLIGRLTAHGALRLRYGDFDSRTEVLRDDGSGAPVVHGLPQAGISLSHSGDRVACVVAPAGRAIGIDVEWRGRCDPVLARRILGPGERLRDGLDPTVLWAVKEAAYKAALGRWPGLRDYPVDWQPEGPVVTLPDRRRLPGRILNWDGTVVALVGHQARTVSPIVLNHGSWWSPGLTEPSRGLMMSLTEDAALQAVREGLAAELNIPVDDIAGTAALDLLPRADSVRLLRVVARLENDFDIEFDDEDVRTAETVADLVALLLAGVGGSAVVR